MRVLYRRVPRLLDELALARADCSYARLLAKLAKVEILVLDDWGLGTLKDSQRMICSRCSRTGTAGRPPS